MVHIVRQELRAELAKMGDSHSKQAMPWRTWANHLRMIAKLASWRKQSRCTKKRASFEAHAQGQVLQSRGHCHIGDHLAAGGWQLRANPSYRPHDTAHVSDNLHGPGPYFDIRAGATALIAVGATSGSRCSFANWLSQGVFPTSLASSRLMLLVVSSIDGWPAKVRLVL